MALKNKFEIKTIDTANNVVSEVFNNRDDLKITKLQDLQEIKDAINFVEDVLKTNFLEEYELGLIIGDRYYVEATATPKKVVKEKEW